MFEVWRFGGLEGFGGSTSLEARGLCGLHLFVPKSSWGWVEPAGQPVLPSMVVMMAVIDEGDNGDDAGGW